MVHWRRLLAVTFSRSVAGSSWRSVRAAREGRRSAASPRPGVSRVGVSVVAVALTVVGFTVLWAAASPDRANAAAVGDVPYCWQASAGVPIGHAATVGAVYYCVAPEAFRVALAGVSPNLAVGSGSLALDPSSLFKFAFRQTVRQSYYFEFRDYAECRMMDVPTSPVLYLSCGGSPTLSTRNSRQSINASYSGAVRASASGSFGDVAVPFSQPLYDMGDRANTDPVLHASGAKLFAPEGAIVCKSVVGYYQCSLPYSVMVAMGMDAFECVTPRCGVYNESDPTETVHTRADVEVGPYGGCAFAFNYVELPPGRMNDPTFLRLSAGSNSVPGHCDGLLAGTARYRPNKLAPWVTIPVATGTLPSFITNGAGAVPPPFGAILKPLIGGAKGQSTVADPVNTSTGTFTHSETDLEAPGGAAGLRVERWYDSSDTRTGILGLGWASAWSDTLKSDDDGGFSFAESTGRTTTFRPALVGGWTHPTGVDASLVLRADGSPALLYTSGDVVEFNVAGQIEQRTFADNQSLTIARTAAGGVSTVTSSSGASLTFTYVALSSGASRLTAVAGSWGQGVTYTYGVGDRLATATRPGAVTTYTYEPAKGLLTAVTDASGVREVFNVYNAYRQVISQTAASGAVTTFTYNATALSTTVHDPVTNTDLTYTHDASGRVVTITDPYGKVVTRTWDGQSNALGAVNRNGTSVANTFDANNNLLTSTDPKTGTTTYTYDTSNRVLTVTDPWGALTTYGYASTDRIPSTVTDPLNHVTTSVITNGLVTSTTDADGVTTSFGFDTNRRLTSTTNGLGKQTLFEYDTAGRRTKVTTPAGRVTSTIYDAAGRVKSITAPDLGATSYLYDAAGRTLLVTDPTLAVTSYTYDTAGRTGSMTAPNGAVTSYTYDGNDQLTLTTEPGGGTTSSTLGPLGRVLSTTDQQGRVTAYEYDADGNQTKVTKPGGATSTTTLDTVGRVASTADAAGRSTVTTYDSHGRVQSVTAPGGQVTSYTYDVLGRTFTVTDPIGGVTSTGYTPGGRTASVQNPAGLVTTYAYDLAGRQKTVSEPGGRTTTMTYDDDGGVLTTLSPGGLLVTRTYDPAGRVATITDPAGVLTTRTWSKRSELLTDKHGAEGTVIYEYDPVGTMKSVTDSLGNKTSFAYDLRGNRTSRTNAIAGVDAWAYNAANELTSTTDPLNRSSTVSYDAAGRQSVISDPSGRTVTNTYNLDGTLATRTHAQTGAPNLVYTYGYDTIGRLSTVTDGAGSYSYSYTAGGLLASVANPVGRTIAYGYDNAGRRTKMTYPDGNSFLYGYDAAGRLASIAPGEVLADSFTTANTTVPDTSRWTTALTAGGTATVQGNELALAWATTASSAAKITSKAPATVDQNVSLRYRFANTTSPGTLTLQARSSTAGNYRLVIASNSATATVFKQLGTTSTALGTFTVPIGTTAQRIRFQVQGTAIKARTWADGTTEPTVWGASFTDTAVTATGVTFVAASRTAAGTNTVLVDDYSETNPTAPLAAVAAYGYDLDSQLTLETLAGGTRTRTYTNGRLTTFNQNLPGAILATSRTFDTTGRIGTETTGTVTATFGYDAASQLTTVTPSTGSATVYTYDTLGRRATSKVGTAAAQTYTYDAGSQLTAIGTNTFTYDAVGRRLTDTTTATNKAIYTYDQAGRLATIARVNGTTTTTQTRTYNPTDLLASVSNLTGTATTTTGIDWDTTQGVAQPVDFVSAGLTDLVNGPGGWVATKAGATSMAIAQDVYGSAVPSTGVTIARNAAYSPLGIAAGTNTFEPRLGYRGEITLDNLTYLRARNYDPSRGQFTSRDPIVGKVTVANPYHYVDNKPLRQTDPLGLSPKDGALTGAAAAARPLARCTFDTNGNWEGHQLTQFHTWLYTNQFGTGFMDFPVPGGGPSGWNTGCADVYNYDTGEVYEVKPAHTQYGLDGSKQVARYVTALNSIRRPSLPGRSFAPAFLPSLKPNNWGYVTFSGRARWEGVRFYAEIPKIGAPNSNSRAQWEQMFDRAIYPQDKKEILKMADTVINQQAPIVGHFEFDVALSGKILAGTVVVAAGVVVIGGACIGTVGLGCPAAVGAGYATAEQFALAA
jgi:RHS repeat-associated protein